MAEILWGYDSLNASSEANRVAVTTNFDEAVNPHMAICGDTGTGKTHTLRKAICEVARTSQDTRFHIFDVHDDIEVDEKITSDVIFSSGSPYGFNPLLIDPDLHSGGVRKAILNFIGVLSLSPTHGRALGPKQRDILSNLILDVFENAGFYADKPETWAAQGSKAPSDLKTGVFYVDVPFAERELAKNAARQDGVKISFDGAAHIKCWYVDEYAGGITRWPLKRWGRTNPTLNDLCQYAVRRREMSFTGLGMREAERLSAVHSKAKSLSKHLQNVRRSSNNNGYEAEETEAERKVLDKAKQDALEAFEQYFKELEHGGALDALLKYDSFDSLSTVRQILESLNNCGVFRDTPPNFAHDKQIWRYRIKHLREEEQIFLVNVRLREIFNAAKARGESNGAIRDVIVIDEGAKFTSKETDHIINVIALEARKFGLAIWFASQSPTHYPEALISSMGTKVILGLDTTYWPTAQTKLRINEADLRWIKPREGMLLQRKLKGVPAKDWQKVISC